MRSVFVLLISVCLLQWTVTPAIAAVTASAKVRLCKIKDRAECQNNCSKPSSCQESCVDCPSACSTACQIIEWEDDGLNKLWRGLSNKQRELFLKGIKIEGK